MSREVFEASVVIGISVLVVVAALYAAAVRGEATEPVRFYKNKPACLGAVNYNFALDVPQVGSVNLWMCP